MPGFLMTSSFDETVKIWDVENGNVSFIAERQFPTVISSLFFYKLIIILFSSRDESIHVSPIQIFRLHSLLAGNPKVYKYGIVPKIRMVTTHPCVRFEILFLFSFLVRSRFGSRAKFEMVEVSSVKTEATEPKVSSFPTTTPNVTSAVLKAQRKKLSKKNK